jgi:thioredoxin-related protein
MKFVIALILTIALVIPMTAQTAAVQGVSTNTSKSFVPVTEYDPARDASLDIAAAIAEADRTGRNVMVEVGGKWCKWCGYLDKFFEQNSSLREFRDQNYVMVKVNFSPENENKKTLSQYPAIAGYPHIFILGTGGKMLQSQDTSKLEEGRGYSTSAVATFLQEWAPKK